MYMYVYVYVHVYLYMYMYVYVYMYMYMYLCVYVCLKHCKKWCYGVPVLLERCTNYSSDVDMPRPLADRLEISCRVSKVWSFVSLDRWSQLLLNLEARSLQAACQPAQWVQNHRSISQRAEVEDFLHLFPPAYLSLLDLPSHKDSATEWIGLHSFSCS